MGKCVSVFSSFHCNQLRLTPLVCFLSYSLTDAGGVHLEEGVVHEEVEGLFLPGTAGVLVSTQAA